MRKLNNVRDLNPLRAHIPFFVGAYPHDVRPRPPTPYSIILNTDNHTKPGKHWVALHVTANTLYFCDSGGRHHSDSSFPKDFRKNIARLCRNGKHGKHRKAVYNQKQVQPGTNSVCCGHYSLYYLNMLLLDKKNPFKIFTDDLVKNDRIVYRYYKRNFYGLASKRYISSRGIHSPVGRRKCTSKC